MRGGATVKMGKTVYECKGVPSYTLNALAREGVNVSKIRTGDGTFRFTISTEFSDKTKNILEGTKREYRVLEEKNLLSDLRNFLLRYTFIAGVIISFALVYVYSTLVTEISVTGNEIVDSEILRGAVSELLPTPSVFAAPDMAAIEKRLVACEGIAYAKVYKSGRTLVAEVVEELPVTGITDTQKPIPLLARESGTITKIVTLRGTPAVKEGDKVKAGQVLVYPYVTGSEEEKIPVKGMGIIEAKVLRAEKVEYAAGSLKEEDIAGEIERRKAEYVKGLGKDEIFLGSSFELKKLDKSTTISIYYEIITRIS